MATNFSYFRAHTGCHQLVVLYRRKNTEKAHILRGSARPKTIKNSILKSDNYYCYYWYSALGPVWAETRVQSGDWYGSGTLHPGQVLRGSLPLLSPTF